jgi:hypothetical protein
MEKYHKIQSVFKRYITNVPEGVKKGSFIEGEYTCYEFEYLKNNTWIGTEKIDGTNIRINWDGRTFQISGKSDNSQIPKPLEEKLQEIIKNQIPRTHSIFAEPFTLYGEGYGNKIQKDGAGYIKDGVDFILFDIKIGKWWLKREDVTSIGREIGLRTVPVIFIGTLGEAMRFVREGFLSRITLHPRSAEGLVLVPMYGLLDRNSNRIITKMKTKDW